MTASGTEPAPRAATPPAQAPAASKQRAPSARDMAGRKREYETIYILRPDSTTDVIAQVNQKIRGIVEAGGGTMLKVDNWGKRKLAYEVKKQLKGIYLYWQYLGNAGTVEEIERNLRLLEQVIRYYTVKIDEDVDPAARPSAVDEEAFNKAATTVPDEEELATGAAPMPRFHDDDDDDDEFMAPLDDEPIVPPVDPTKAKE
jgi:small subunit ribosomal protein S6